MPAALTPSPVPATADRPEYRGYPVRLTLTDGGVHRLCGGDTVEELLASPWLRHASKPVVIAEQISPMGTPVISARVAGGTWSGSCGSLRWVVDTDEQVRDRETFLAALSGKPFYGFQQRDCETSKSQAWWVNRIRTREKHGWDGFYVECEQQYRHTGLCRLREWTWDGSALRVVS